MLRRTRQGTLLRLGGREGEMRYGEMAAGRRGGEIEKLLRQCDNGSDVICWEIGHVGGTDGVLSTD